MTMLPINVLATQPFDAADWSVKEDDFTQVFYDQNRRQLWFPDEIAITGDLLTWKEMTIAQRNVYKKALAGLTLLDTEQGNNGMPRIMMQVKGHQRKAVLNFMAMMENFVHAKSYSNIFMSLASTEEIRELHVWVKNNKFLQKKTKLINDVYNNIKDDDEISLYKGMVASVLLESFLFYSGFYYPLLCYGQGNLMQSGEIINLIIRDESIHGMYIGALAQEIFNKQPENVKAELAQFAPTLMHELYLNELEYTEDVYSEIGLDHDVKKFIRYNANKALDNLGFDAFFEKEQQNAVVINGLNTQTKAHDFFSMKGNGYKMALIEPIQDADFYFDDRPRLLRAQ